MAWTNAQKKLLAVACRQHGIADEHRRLILQQVPGHRAIQDGRVTSTAGRLTNGDFEYVMAVVERTAGGRLLHYQPGHFRSKADDELTRMRRFALQLTAQLEATGNLEPGGVGLRGWIEKRVTRGATDDIEELDFQQLYNLIEGLKAFSRRLGVRVDG